MGEVLVTGKLQKHIPPFGFQTYFFEELKQEADILNLKLFFADPLQQNLSFINKLEGFELSQGLWRKVKFKLPKIIYHRFSSIETTEQVISEKFLQLCLKKDCQLANPLALVKTVNDKWLFYQFLGKNGMAEIPTKKLDLNNENDLYKWLDTYKNIYIKPVKASNGRGVVKLIKSNKSILSLSSQGVKSIIEKEGVLSILDSKNLIIQPAIAPLNLGLPPFDIRVMVQHNSEKLLVSGLGIRMGEINSPISNLKGGGKALPVEALSDLLYENQSCDMLVNQITKKCLHLSSLFTKEFGQFCELAFDILLDKNLNPVILEANANPGRWLFTKIADLYEGEENDFSKKMHNKYGMMRRKTVSTPMKYLQTLTVNY